LDKGERHYINGKILHTRGGTALKIAYFDCFSGISGDMCLGALVDAGFPFKKLVRELKKIPVRGYEIHAKKVKRAGVAATKVDVIQKARSKEQGARRWKDVKRIIHNSSLSNEIKEKGLKIFERLFKAEAKVHGETFDSVHFHELGAVDCLIDVFGTIIGLDLLEVEKVYSSPLNLGSGSIKTGHGILPVPAPASAEILKGVPVYSTDIDCELTTPTGAVLVKQLSSEFGGLPLMNIETIGFGAGSQNFKDRPNVLRLFVGDSLPPFRKPNPPIPPLEKGGKGARLPSVGQGFEKGGLGRVTDRQGFLTPQKGSFDEKVTVIEANIDDMNPQIYEYVMEKLFKAGSLDVFLTQILMKKGRPGIKLTVLCKETGSEELIKIIMKETTTIGLRFYDVKRRILQREIKLVDTEFGKVRVKLSRLGDEILKVTPEYEDCKRIAKKLGIPLIAVMKRIRIPVTK
jgi:uncharacterized protein (TIGR00299 family) protein